MGVDGTDFNNKNPQQKAADLATLANSNPLDMMVKDQGKTKRYKVVKKDQSKKEVENELAKAEAIIQKEGGHKLPSEKEILEKAQQMYMADNFQPKYNDSAPETLPTKGELSEEGYLQKAKLALMTSQDTQASRSVMDYVEGLRAELNKIGFEVIPMEGFSVEDIKY